MATVMKSSAKTAPAVAAPVRDGMRFNLAAPETLLLPEEKTPYTRIIDSFVFLVRGRLEPLPQGWDNDEILRDVQLVGAVANLVGSTTELAQCGWFHVIPWRWLHITTICKIQLRNDTRYRNGELCFWVTTKLGEYALMSPHKGYRTQWLGALQCLNANKHIPDFRRTTPEDPKPSWWGQIDGSEWPPVLSGHEAVSVKRPAAEVSESGDGSKVTGLPAAEIRRVRQKTQSSDKSPDQQQEALDTASSASSSETNSSPVSDRQQPPDVNRNIQLLPRVRPWDLIEDRDDRSQGGAKAKPTKKSKRKKVDYYSE